MKKQFLFFFFFLFSYTLSADNFIHVQASQVGYFHHRLIGYISSDLVISKVGFVIGSDSLIMRNDNSVHCVELELLSPSSQFSCILGPGVLKKHTLYYVKAFIISNGIVYYSPARKISTENQKYEVGERMLGGRLLHVFSQGDPLYDKEKLHGIIVADTIISKFKGNVSQTLIKYNKNNSTGFNDWFSPSVIELGILWFHSNLFDLRGKSKFVSSTIDKQQRILLYNFYDVPKVEILIPNSSYSLIPMRYF